MRVGPWQISRVADPPVPAAPRPRRRRPVTTEPLALIQYAACAHFGIPLRDLVGPSRRAHLVHARHLAMWVARETTSASLPQIGRAFGGRDHTTVLHAIRKVRDLLAFPAVAAEVAAIQAEVEQVWDREVVA